MDNATTTNGNGIASPISVLDPALIDKLKAELGVKAAKAKIHTTMEAFGTAEEDGKPILTCTMEADADGRIHIILPKIVTYDQTRDTSSKNRRSVVCRLDGTGGLEGFLYPPPDKDGNVNEDKAILVRISLSSTLNLSYTAVKA